MQPINITLGTAGHIDHGKTALVKCLTGCDTDRLKEEKERGMSIELGYAPCLIADKEVGIVDVPGHEHFIKTMVAGAAGMDAVLLVVAADDGIMPQTREHLEILTLLDIRHGMVALTKVDRVGPDRRAEVEAQLRAYLQGTFLAAAPIVGVSNVTGEGLSDFVDTLWKLVGSIEPKPVEGVFRMPLERGFSAEGCGTVVAGVPVSGAVRLEDEVVLLPQGQAGRVRRIEVYGRTSDAALAGQCAALNVRHWDHRALGRGDVVATPGYFTPAAWVVTRLRLLPAERLTIKNGMQVKLHTGTTETVAAAYALEGGALQPGGSGLVQFRCATPIVAGPGDRFILRTNSPVRTVGGGVILEVADVRRSAKTAGTVARLSDLAASVGDRLRLVEHSLRYAEETVATAAEIARRTKLTLRQTSDAVEALIGRGLVVRRQAALTHVRSLAAACDTVAAEVGRFHAATPDSPGIEPDELRRRAGLARRGLDAAVEAMVGDGRLLKGQGRLALATHRPQYRAEDVAPVAAIEDAMLAGRFAPPEAAALAATLGLPKANVERLLKLLVDNGRLVTVAPGLLFHRTAVDAARATLVDYLKEKGRLESVDFKYLLDTTRKFAIPLLDYFDRAGVTRRVGNTRFPKT